MSKPILDIRYETNLNKQEIIAYITKPNDGDRHMASILSQVAASEFAKRYMDEFYPKMKHLVDSAKVEAAIADEIVRLGMLKLKEQN